MLNRSVQAGNFLTSHTLFFPESPEEQATADEIQEVQDGPRSSRSLTDSPRGRSLTLRQL